MSRRGGGRETEGGGPTGPAHSHRDGGHAHPDHSARATAASPAEVAGLREGVVRRLRWVLLLTAGFMVAEVVGGVLSGSLALLADAGHMFTDAGAVGLSLLAVWWSRKPPSPEKTFGYVRLEILAALVNGATLLLISGLIVWEAVERFREPGDIEGPLMLVVAVAGLAVNVVGALLLHRHSEESLNVRGAYLHVLGDILGSVGAITAAGVILWTGWTPVDPLVSILIALLILVSAWRLVREATEVLLEAAPSHVDVAEILQELGSVEHLHDVHDLHVWTLTSGFVALSGHGVLDDPSRHREVLREVRERLGRHGIGHVTFQLEPRPLYRLPPSDGGEPERERGGPEASSSPRRSS